MSDRRKLSEQEVRSGLAEAPGWSLDGVHIARELVFKDFVEAFSFITRVALVAERMDHHPEWSNIYKTVRIRLSTHDAGGITALDFELAKKIDALAGR